LLWWRGSSRRRLIWLSISNASFGAWSWWRRRWFCCSSFRLSLGGCTFCSIGLIFFLCCEIPDLADNPSALIHTGIIFLCVSHHRCGFFLHFGLGWLWGCSCFCWSWSWSRFWWWWRRCRFWWCGCRSRTFSVRFGCKTLLVRV